DKGRTPEKAKDKDTDHEDEDDKTGPAAAMNQTVRTHVLDGERIAGLVTVDRFVFGAVVLKDAPDILHKGDRADIRDEEAHLKPASKHVKQDVAADVRVEVP